MNTTRILNNKISNRCMKFRVAFDPVKRLLALSVIGVLAVFATFRANAAATGTAPPTTPTPPATGTVPTPTLSLPMNGDFETGDLSFWTTFAGFDGGVTSAEAFRGSYSLELDPSDIVFQELGTPRRFEVLEFCAKVDDQFWAMTEDPDTDIIANAMVQYSDGSWRMLEFGTDLSSDDYATTSYGEHWRKGLSLPLDSTKQVVRVYFIAGCSNPAPIYIDHVRLLYPH